MPDTDDDLIAVSELSKLQRAYLRDGEIKSGKISRRTLQTRMSSAADTELSRLRERGEQVAMRSTGADHGRRILTTEISGFEEARMARR